MTRKSDQRKEPAESHEIMQVKHEEYTHGEGRLEPASPIYA
jgi:hypothetical protein